MKKLAFVMGAVTFASFGYLVIHSTVSSRHDRQAVFVEVAPVVEMNIRDSGKLSGELKPVSETVISSEITGVVTNIYVKHGDMIERNMLLVRIDDRDVRLKMDRVQKEIDAAYPSFREIVNRYAISEREYQRIKRLKDEGKPVDAELERIRTQYEARKAEHDAVNKQLNETDAALRAAKLELAKTEIKASWETGGNIQRMVAEIFISEGDVATPEMRIVSIANIETVKVSLTVARREFRSLSVGRELIFTTESFPGKFFPGRIVAMDPALDEKTRTAKVELEILNPELILKPGMTVKSEIFYSEKKKAPAVPVSAITKINGVEGVFVVNTDRMKVKFVPATFGIRNEKYAELLSPKIQNPVVVTGVDSLKNGSPVTFAPPTGETESVTGEVEQ